MPYHDPLLPSTTTTWRSRWRRTKITIVWMMMMLTNLHSLRSSLWMYACLRSQDYADYKNLHSLGSSLWMYSCLRSQDWMRWASTALGEACRRVSLPPGASTERYYLITSMSYNIIGLILLLILVENSMVWGGSLYTVTRSRQHLQTTFIMYTHFILYTVEPIQS